jgi:hypothetical protein
MRTVGFLALVLALALTLGCGGANDGGTINPSIKDAVPKDKQLKKIDPATGTVSEK